MPQALAWTIFKSVVKAISYLHEYGITHRDIKA